MKKRILGGAIVLIVLITSILLGDIPFCYNNIISGIIRIKRTYRYKI